MQNSHRRGFTLIELLVVMGITGILAAILLPVLARVQLRGQQVICANNLRQLACAHSMYILDYNKDFAYQDSEPFYYGWGSLLVPFATNAASVQLCPSAPPPMPTPPANANDGINYGQSDLAACIYVTKNGPPFQSSYAFNGWFYTGNPPPQLTVVIDDELPIDDTTNHFLSDSAVRYPSQTPVFADAMLPETWPVPSDLASTDLRHGQTVLSDALEYMMMRVTIARHGGRPASAAPASVDINQPLPGAINVALFDGHVEQARLQNLWNYNWNYGWHIPSNNPP